MELLDRGASELDLELTPQQLEQFEIYYRELADWNRRVNLTAITDYREVQVKHFLDSLSAYLAFPRISTCRVRLVDVGTGAGFPGVPLKLAFPQIHLVLVESVGKKSRFLEHLVEVLGLSSVEVSTGRAEELARTSEFRESFDLVVSRGVAKLPVPPGVHPAILLCGRPGGPLKAGHRGGTRWGSPCPGHFGWANRKHLPSPGPRP